MKRTADPCLAVIPARGGSKGLPGKNIRLLAGLPLLVHSLRCAALVPRLARTIVSTDSEEIAGVARAAGGDVPFMRPPELAADDTPMMAVLAHALAEVERLEGRRYESLLLLDPTSPFRLPDDVARAFDVLESDLEASGVVACSKPSFNPLWVGVFERDRYLVPAFSAEAQAAWGRRQDVPAFLRINGALYLWRSDFVRGAPARWLDDRHRAVHIPERRAFSIDDREEFDLAQLLLTSGTVAVPWLPGGAA